jgi:hypothetical protein
VYLDDLVYGDMNQIHLVEVWSSNKHIH